jgi:ABC-type Fe3+/spermidine/putrescine transport system ATPase subunit
LARALVNRPRVLLLDEPLSALDLRIRLELEVELRRIHRETGATFVFVTHDQREALALSDRVVVFDQGRVEQVGTPDAVYRNPSSAYVARFVGEANVIPVDVSANGTGTIARVGEHRLVLDGRQATEGDAWLVVRSEAISLGPMDDAQLRGTVRDVAFRGSGYAYRIDVSGLPEPLKVETAGAGEPHDVGRAVGIRWDAASACVIPRGPGEGPEPAPEAVG